MWALQSERRYIEPWKFLSYAVTHFNGFHFLNNLIGQLILGYLLEISHSSWMVGLIYSLGIITAGVGSYTTRKEDDLSPLVGSSGNK